MWKLQDTSEMALVESSDRKTHIKRKSLAIPEFSPKIWVLVKSVQWPIYSSQDLMSSKLISSLLCPRSRANDKPWARQLKKKKKKICSQLVVHVPYWWYSRAVQTVRGVNLKSYNRKYKKNVNTFLYYGLLDSIF